MTVTVGDWQKEVAAVRASLIAPADVWLIHEHHSKQSESAYLALVKQARLYVVRLAFHDQTAADPWSFNLRRYPGRRALVRAIQARMAQPAQGLAVEYATFVALAFVEKANQTGGELHRLADHFFYQGQAVAPPVAAQLAPLLAAHLCLVSYRDQRVLLTSSGRALLAGYFDFADHYHPDEAAWDQNPRTMTPRELIARLLL